MWPELAEKMPQPSRCSCHVCTTNARKMRQQLEPGEFQRSGAHLFIVRRKMTACNQSRQGQGRLAAEQTTSPPQLDGSDTRNGSPACRSSLMQGYLPDGLRENASTKSSARSRLNRSRTLESMGREAALARDRVLLFSFYMCMLAMAVASL